MDKAMKLVTKMPLKHCTEIKGIARDCELFEKKEGLDSDEKFFLFNGNKLGVSCYAF